jgi:hypothetical protein
MVQYCTNSYRRVTDKAALAKKIFRYIYDIEERIGDIQQPLE